ncbi:hypothetical protein GNI_004430 [Gregarina niphandrodes]|uniref:Uncharacterized protein n=1 Tax=Gregarina niphandrodes TaxID=110365 RepID=A0A023BDH3_GRENI|nr:hypothetical protein GNI_004430 [Gregarina niphandrodes]EZG88494.1 hypothetical protein GNI_004430 [Gregarina niphandrodes]|eukprot:XP_011128555.1 hypothetical protein GNI_004430 [Gregarina niphandrodes]
MKGEGKLLTVNWIPCNGKQILEHIDTSSGSWKHAYQLASIIEWENILTSCIDRTSLRIDDTYQWKLTVSVTCLSDDGNIRDLGLEGSIHALRNLQMPKLEWDKERRWWRENKTTTNLQLLYWPFSVTLMRSEQGVWIDRLTAEIEGQCDAMVVVTILSDIYTKTPYKSCIDHLGVISYFDLKKVFDQACTICLAKVTQTVVAGS